MARERQKRTEEIAREKEDLKAEVGNALRAPLLFAHRLVETIEKRDGHTARLAAASSVYAADAAGELGLDPTRAEKIRVAALL